MKIVRVPLRISLGGGGTDLPSWYEKHGSFFISAAIDKYIYFTGNFRNYDNNFWMGYSKTDIANKISDIKHELLSTTLEYFNVHFREFKEGLEIHSISDVPGKSGLGSSGAFLSGLIYLLNCMMHYDLTKKEIAELACMIEINLLKKSSGKQDQYITCNGGIKSFEINREGKVTYSDLNLNSYVTSRLKNNLLIYYSGVTRDADEVLKEQKKNFMTNSQIEKAMHKIQDIGRKSYQVLIDGNLDRFGELMHEHWETKKTVAESMTDQKINLIYDKGISYGALGGKIMGAGGGGFFLFYVPEEKQNQFRIKMKNDNYIEMNWNFDNDGCSVIYSK